MTQTTVNAKDDTQYGSVANGMQVGSGYDVEIKRVSASLALVNVMTPNGERDYLGTLDIEAGTDLQSEAREIGQNAGPMIAECVAKDQAGWADLAERWNAIEVVR